MQPVVLPHEPGGPSKRVLVPCQCQQHSSLGNLQAYYYGDKAAVSNEEFDNLKEELTWEGSKVVLLR